MSKKNSFISHLIAEAQAYRTIEEIEKLVDSSGDLSAIPIQPLYMCLKSTSVDYLAGLLPRLSKSQRQALLDIDIWYKDNLSLDQFENWPLVYAKSGDLKISKEFACSQEFWLYLKGKFNIYSFDLENPQYPNHDNFFITEDNAFLFEFSKDYHLMKEVQYMIKLFYSEKGIEEASFELMQMISESFYTVQEDVYQDKVNRLRDYGFVDYFEALNFRASFASIKEIEDFIKKKVPATGEIDSASRNQTLHSSSLVSFSKGLDDLHVELEKITDNKRVDYLHFNFIRLVNGTVTLDDSLKGGSLAMTKTGQKTRQKILLGMSQVRKLVSDKDVFSHFDFTDVYKIGHSLINLEKIRLKKALEASPFDNDKFEFFMGNFWNQILQNSFEEVVKYYCREEEQFVEIKQIEHYDLWVCDLELFIASLPFVKTFFDALQKLISSGHLNDSFYLNYSVDNIDYEAILMSSFVNFTLGHFEKENVNKMGLTIDELKSFIRKYFKKSKGQYNIPEPKEVKFKDTLLTFSKSFGMGEIDDFPEYLYLIVKENLSGYQFDDLSDEDFKHVGGPILLSTKQ